MILVYGEDDSADFWLLTVWLKGKWNYIQRSLIKSIFFIMTSRNSLHSGINGGKGLSVDKNYHTFFWHSRHFENEDFKIFESRTICFFLKRLFC